MIDIENELGPFWKMYAKRENGIECDVCDEGVNAAIFQVYSKYLHIGPVKIPLWRYGETQCASHSEVSDEF